MTPPVPRPSVFYKLFTDGACRGNPGPSAAGAALYTPQGDLLATTSQKLPVMTNNAAEYHACLQGLQLARMHNAQRLIVHSDSELLVRQVRGQYRTTHPHLQMLNQRVEAFTTNWFDVCRFVHVTRDRNVLADGLANAAFDDGGVMSADELARSRVSG